MENFSFANVKHYKCIKCFDSFSNLPEFVNHQISNSECGHHQPIIIMDEQFETSAFEEDSFQEVPELPEFQDRIQYRKLVTLEI